MSKNITNSDFRHELLKAVRDGNEQMVKSLLDEGVDVNTIDEYGVTALMNAILFKNVGVVKVLLDNGADVNMSNNSAETALTYAIKDKNKEIVKLLLEFGADINKGKGDLYNGNLLVNDKILGDKEMLEFLSAKGSNVNLLINTTDNEGKTLLVYKVKVKVKELELFKEQNAHKSEHIDYDSTSADSGYSKDYDGRVSITGQEISSTEEL
ncbi:MAG: ankyrin repeat domain-containing protein [Rickettsiaceae bacterium]|nr:ankyrin repeat domain-containing protein [Rickettsiaceae bacterium]